MIAHFPGSFNVEGTSNIIADGMMPGV